MSVDGQKSHVTEELESVAVFFSDYRLVPFVDAGGYFIENPSALWRILQTKRSMAKPGAMESYWDFRQSIELVLVCTKELA